MNNNLTDNVKTILSVIKENIMKFIKIAIIIGHTIFCFYIITNLLPLVNICSNVRYFNKQNYTDVNYRGILSETLNICMNKTDSNIYKHIQNKYWVMI